MHYVCKSCEPRSALGPNQPRGKPPDYKLKVIEDHRCSANAHAQALVLSPKVEEREEVDEVRFFFEPVHEGNFDSETLKAKVAKVVNTFKHAVTETLRALTDVQDIRVFIVVPVNSNLFPSAVHAIPGN